MTQIPVLLPGTMPLVPQPDLPGQTPTPGAAPFLTLLAQLLGTPATPGEPAKAAPAPSDAEVAAEPGDGAAPDAAPDAAPELPAAEAPLVPVLPVLPVLPQVAAALVVTVPVPAAPMPTPTPTPKAAPGTKADSAPLGAAPVVGASVDAAAPLPEAPSQPQPAGQPQQPAGPAAATPAAVPVTVAPAVGPVAHVAAPAAAQAPAPVAHQVFPEVVRIAVSGESPKRVVLRLQPEHLGEVRVVLRTGRAGLEVSLAAGSDARTAIREGAPELRRMLEAAGSPDARILVRHLPDGPAAAPVAAPTPTTPARTDAPTPLLGTSVDVGAGTAGGTAHGDRRDQPQQDAPPLATDGHHRPVETGRPRRASGLDVMM